MKRVVLITSHYLGSDRKAGFHWLAEAFCRAGWQVLFFTESVSWLSRLRGDPRCRYPLARESYRLRRVRERLSSFVWMTPFHPVNLRWGPLNRLGGPLLGRYADLPLGEAGPQIAAADLLVFDSDHGLLLFDRFKRMNPRARFVYRVSDHLAMMGHHPLLPAQEERVLPRFDLVSVPSPFFRQRLGQAANVRLHRHGLEKRLFDVRHPNPYRAGGHHVLFVGRHHFDADFLHRARGALPDWTFHVFGAVEGVPDAANVRRYGERPFGELVPYLQHADVGLQTLTFRPGAESFTDSLKMNQYTYCRLPIVAPEFLRNDRPHVHYYQPGDTESIRRALLAARAYDRACIPVADILSWDEIAGLIAA